MNNKPTTNIEQGKKTSQDIKKHIKEQIEQRNKERTKDALDKLIEIFDTRVTMNESTDPSNDSNENPDKKYPGFIFAAYNEFIKLNNIEGMLGFDELEITADDRTQRFFEIETIAMHDTTYVTPPLILQMLVRKPFYYFVSTKEIILLCKNINRVLFMRPNIWKHCRVQSFTIYIKKLILESMEHATLREKRNIMKKWCATLQSNLKFLKFNDKQSELLFLKNMRSNLITRTTIDCLFSMQWFETGDTKYKETDFVEFWLRVLESDMSFLNDILHEKSVEYLQGKIPLSEYKEVMEDISFKQAFINVSTVYNIFSKCVDGIKNLYANEELGIKMVNMIPFKHNLQYKNKELEEEKVFASESFANDWGKILYMRNETFDFGSNALEDVIAYFNLNVAPSEQFYLLNAEWHSRKDIKSKIYTITERHNTLNALLTNSALLNPNIDWIEKKIEFHLKSMNYRDLPYLMLCGC